MEETMSKKALALVFFSLVLAKCTSSQLSPSNGMSFQQCYVGCFILCAIQPTQTLSSCGLECLRDCLIPQNSDNNSSNSNKNNNNRNSSNNVFVTSLHFCNLGCASVHCSNISTLKNPGGKEVASCVGSCSGTCKKSFKASP